MSLRDVLAVLEDDDARFWSTFTAAVSLADRERARLTLVKTCHTPPLTLWCGPFAPGAIYLPPESDPPEVLAQRRLARAAEFVPMEICLTTRVLSGDPLRALSCLMSGGQHDALVATAGLLRRARRLRRICSQEDISVVSVALTPRLTRSPQPARPSHAIPAGV